MATGQIVFDSTSAGAFTIQMTPPVISPRAIYGYGEGSIPMTVGTVGGVMAGNLPATGTVNGDMGGTITVTVAAFGTGFVSGTLGANALGAGERAIFFVVAMK